MEILSGGIIKQPGNTKTQNTGSWREGPPAKWQAEKCIQCFLCVNVCPENAIRVQGGRTFSIDETKCKGCGICVNECPAKAMVRNDD